MDLKIYKFEFSPAWPIGSCLVIIAKNKKQAKKFARETIKHTSNFVISSVGEIKPGVVEYMPGDY